jgi:hypothetical protein
LVGIKPGDTLDLEILEDGRIMLIPVEAVPKHQLWAWTADAKESISASIADPRPSTAVESAEEAKKHAARWSSED